MSKTPSWVCAFVMDRVDIGQKTLPMPGLKNEPNTKIVLCFRSTLHPNSSRNGGVEGGFQGEGRSVHFCLVEGMSDTPIPHLWQYMMPVCEGCLRLAEFTEIEQVVK